ncbi:AraC family transcriptional regulator [Draconibacterium sp.]|nr:AraC family transcriptional regulator [Draconibacterium sp.]
MSNIFSEVKGINIQQFIIIHKIEGFKELLIYDELNLTEISYKLYYSSVAYLSNQFKKITGLTLTFYKHLKDKRRQNLEDFIFIPGWGFEYTGVYFANRIARAIVQSGHLLLFFINFCLFWLSGFLTSYAVRC